MKSEEAPNVEPSQISWVRVHCRWSEKEKDSALSLHILNPTMQSCRGPLHSVALRAGWDLWEWRTLNCSLHSLSTEPVTLPFIQATNTTVKELDTVFLTCFSNDTGISIQSFNGQSLELTDEMKLSQTKNTLTIDPVRREDSGKYRCEVSNPVSSKWSDPNQLDIIGEWPLLPPYSIVLEMGLILYQQCAKWVKVIMRKKWLKIQI